ncbi:MAG: hydrogenase maturation protease [Candidatus Marinimicrobia bacterium]|nr:hydrogenase maturation protease [Candidatus Neomarinimicrobiota bacterium]MBT3632732.1 hydrogenase maturation protease [Candidatus Neomarinimicrobiota bacterium]MBT3681842.1 hydrogenase maturation protease [Candidatus Neomarinimicrobiota bacterium]MBT3760525.1 hydrogenase maturation protease [Candidatus Neomarinimicrobiota bacterium]MBT3896671.1 hydrogenase maturation protease [Candidatus Neomarinimicrobiota bacterium]
MNPSIHFYSVGNPLYADDGVGLAVIDALKKIPQFETATFFDAHTDALSLIDKFNKNGLNIIIDAARMGKPPGHVEVIQKENVKLVIQWDHLSLHGFGLAETITLAEKIEMLPDNLWVVGIEPETIQIDVPISEIITAAIPVAVNKIINEVIENGQL